MSDRPGEAYIHRYNELVKKLLGAKGGEPMTELAAELLPVIILEQERPEYAIYKSELLWMCSVGQAASVGNFSHVGVRNPVGSGIISVVEAFAIDVPALVNMVITAHAPVQAGATLTASVQRDFRAKGTPVTQAVAFVNVGIIGATAGQMEVPAGMAPAPLSVVLGENNEILFVPQAANTTIAGWILGRERPVETSERA